MKFKICDVLRIARKDIARSSKREAYNRGVYIIRFHRRQLEIASRAEREAYKRNREVSFGW